MSSVTFSRTRPNADEVDYSRSLVRLNQSVLLAVRRDPRYVCLMGRKTFLETGYLSDQLEEELRNIRAANAEWFDLIEDVAACLQQTAVKACDTVRGTPFEPHPLGLLVLHRANGLIQGAILLLERGMVVEAKTLVRSLLECAFVLAALHEQPEAVKRMLIEDMDAAKKGQAKALLKIGAATDTKALQERLKEFGEVRQMSIDKLADLGVLKSLYLQYRLLSNDAVHPSGKSLRRHMVVADDGKSWGGYRFGPGPQNEIADAAYLIFLAGVPVGVAFQQMIGDKENNARMGEIVERSKTLVETMKGK